MSRKLIVSICVLAVIVGTLALTRRMQPQMNDLDALQGLWRIESSFSNGQRVGESERVPTLGARDRAKHVGCVFLRIFGRLAQRYGAHVPYF